MKMLGIDLGSNTLRYCLLDENLRIVKEGEFVIGAARGLEKSGKISLECIEKLKQCLKTMQDLNLDLKSANAVATAAFRKALNTEEIFKTLKQEFQINFRLITPFEEAKLSILGMDNALKRLNLKALQKAYLDLGGASFELSFQKYFKSFNIGIISFYEQAKDIKTRDFQGYDFSKILQKYPGFAYRFKDKKLRLQLLIRDKNFLKIAFLAFDKTKNIKNFLTNFKSSFMILNSGVPTAVVALKKRLDLKHYDASKINGSRLRKDDFLHFALKLIKMSEQQAELKVGKNRKNHLIAGCFLFYALFDKEKIIVVDEGVREGLCIEALNLKEIA